MRQCPIINNDTILVRAAVTLTGTPVMDSQPVTMVAEW